MIVTAIVNVKAITPARILEDAAVLVEKGKILRVSETPGPEELAGADTVIDGQGLYASSGFIDIHVHGGGGHDTTDGDPDGIVEMCRAHARHGTTSLLPTTLAAPIPVLLNAIDAVREAQKRCDDANILGVYLEGPYFSQKQRGAQSAEYILEPTDRREYLSLLDRWDGIKMMSVAPELPGALALGQELHSRGIVPSIGHSDATYQQVVEAIEHGFSDVTHIYSGCSGVVRVNSYRIAGVVEAGLLHQQLTVQVIGDGKHLPGPLLALIYKCKGADGISLITDGLSFSASELVEGTSYRQKNGVEVVLEDGVMKLPDRQSFAGSVATSNRLVRNMMRLGGASLSDAVKMATATPARVIGVGDRKGKLAPGYDADIILFDSEVDVRFVMVGSKVIRNDLA